MESRCGDEGGDDLLPRLVKRDDRAVLVLQAYNKHISTLYVFFFFSFLPDHSGSSILFIQIQPQIMNPDTIHEFGQIITDGK